MDILQIIITNNNLIHIFKDTMDIRKKTSVHIGLFGHIDSGKTAIAEVLSQIVSTAGIDAHPQSKERGITIDLGFTSFILEDYLITLVDGPGHADLIKISAASVEIIDCALIVIDINKGPQVQTGEHLIMIEALNIKKILVILNKIDLFKGDIGREINKTKNFFASTSFGDKVKIYPVSAKKREGFEALKVGILKAIKSLDIIREENGDTIIPIDHHFSVKGLGAIITGTVLQGKVKINQTLKILPINLNGKVKNIQIFHQNVDEASAGDRTGINIKNIEVNKVYRGCYATSNEEAFDFCNIVDIIVKKHDLFRPETNFGTQVHITLGMSTVVGNMYPYELVDDKRIQSRVLSKQKQFRAILWFNEKVLLKKKKNLMLLSRLDLPPTTLRIMGSAQLLGIHETPPVFYKYKIKKGKITNPNHSQGIVCTGLTQSVKGARKVVGKELEAPFTKILDTFGTKGAVVVGLSDEKAEVGKGDPVLLKELRSFQLKKI
ncbi:MAG: GTP-binding protein [Candidatus Lokiarchaeota archaeon]|nr:GTP-binding protein [Candidatus Lokiarchaeota archaeon]